MRQDRAESPCFLTSSSPADRLTWRPQHVHFLLFHFCFQETSSLLNFRYLAPLLTHPLPVSHGRTGLLVNVHFGVLPPTSSPLNISTSSETRSLVSCVNQYCFSFFHVYISCFTGAFFNFHTRLMRFPPY